MGKHHRASWIEMLQLAGIKLQELIAEFFNFESWLILRWELEISHAGSVYDMEIMVFQGGFVLVCFEVGCLMVTYLSA